MAKNHDIQFIRGTAAAATSADLTLLAGEPGYETDTGKLKIGDGSTAWTSLPYFHTDTVRVYQSKSAAYTLLITDKGVFVDATSAAVTITLPTAASSSGLDFLIKKIDSSANAVTIDGDGSETIDGATTKVLSSQYDSAGVVSDGTQFWVV
ncbi:MAG: hypothetical protein KDB22_26585 [Planctomycetales bacterium]|nr:hypothetical protein [Planctomycetales bacterium]